MYLSFWSYIVFERPFYLKKSWSFVSESFQSPNTVLKMFENQIFKIWSNLIVKQIIFKIHIKMLAKIMLMRLSRFTTTCFLFDVGFISFIHNGARCLVKNWKVLENLTYIELFTNFVYSFTIPREICVIYLRLIWSSSWWILVSTLFAVLINNSISYLCLVHFETYVMITI